MIYVLLLFKEYSLETISTYEKTSCQDYIVPGWNDYVKEAHSEARNCYIMWCNVGKPKYGPNCDIVVR